MVAESVWELCKWGVAAKGLLKIRGFKCLFLYLFLRVGKGQREREREDPKQAPRCKRGARREAQTHKR